VKELAEEVAKAMGVKPNIQHLAARNEVVHAYSSHEKAKEYFGDIIQNISLTKGVQRMTAWVKQHGSRSGKAFEGIEVWKNLPPSWKALAQKS
jgi:UDP-glucose 4-epimerase